MRLKLRRKFPGFISPLMVVGVLVILLPIFGMMTLDRMEKQKTQVREQLLATGISLIRTFEAGTRSGMLGMRWGERRLQRMLRETSFQPEVFYIMITDTQGRILAHNDPDQVGSRYGDVPALDELCKFPGRVDYRIRAMSPESVFEVYKRFTPLKSRFHRERKFGHGMMGMHSPGKGRHRGPDQLENLASPGIFADAGDLYIYVGLSMAETDRLAAELVRETLFRGGLYLLLGCVGVISLLSFQAYRNARADLSHVQAFSDNLVQNMPAGLLTIDLAGGITGVNRAARTILGTEPKELPPGMGAMVAEMTRRGESVSAEVEWPHPHGRTLVLDVTASPVRDGAEATGHLFLFKDLTQIKSLTREIKTTRHLAAIGKLAGGVAHEIRNPLSSIKGLATYFGKRYAPGSEDRETAEIMVQEVERINRSITQLLEFANPMAVEKKEVEI
ncbi:MAG: histidine kinase, partial [Desulfobacterales bacterium]|nr:histidine kinase [Desulfobacterales bacterium]